VVVEAFNSQFPFVHRAAAPFGFDAVIGSEAGSRQSSKCHNTIALAIGHVRLRYADAAPGPIGALFLHARSVTPGFEAHLTVH
jgi:hypothetical protein